MGTIVVVMMTNIKVLCYVCDVSNKENVYKVAEMVMKETGGVGILLNRSRGRMEE